MRYYKYLISLRLISVFLLIAPVAFADGVEEQREAAAQKAAESNVGPGMEKVSGERLETAIGHYARSRSLLIAAINEFDKGLKVANPDAILDSEEWRISLIDRAKDLEKVLDPQPRTSRGGVKYSADTRLLNEAGK